VRFTLPAAAVLLTAIPISAQISDAPSGLATIELDRSRACVGVFTEVARIDVMLDPLARNSRRLTAIAQAIAIEDGSVVASLDSTDAVELAVGDWFATDAVLAQRYVTSQDPAILELRTSGREAIKELLADAARAVQADADSILAENEETMLLAGPCDGAILVRSAVLEACEQGSGPVCDEAGRSPAEGDRFRFVDTPESVWEIQEMRPWTAPATLGPGPTGQLEGGRTITYARVGNVVVTVALSPLLKNRTEVTPTELYAHEQTNEALGIIFEHPSIVFAPAFGLRAALPDALADETEYIIHFGAPDQPDTVWRGEADTGLPLEATIPMQATHVIRLRAGDQLSLTAMRSGEPAYTIPLDTINQVTAVESLLAYMATQLSTDLNELIKPVG
jgi:hypothetical protein